MNFSYRDITIPESMSGMPSPVVWDYERMRRDAARLPFYVRVKVDLSTALDVAAKTPYPDAVKVGVMKIVANNEERSISLEQLRIMLGWGARRAQHTGR